MAEGSLQEIVCCMGQPVAGNPTQYMMEKAFQAAGLEWRYLTLEVPPPDLADAVRGMKAMGFRGGNFTIPHKVAVCELLDELTQAAELMGAVNCVFRRDGELVGENTDGKGFVESLAALTDPAEKHVVILGAGGAARAIAVELALAGVADIVIANRNESRGRELAELLEQRVNAKARFEPLGKAYEAPAETEILINATSVGLGDAAAELPLNFDSLSAEMIVADVVFNPPATHLLRTAAERGCPTLDGLGMLVAQAAVAFEIWTGISPDTDLMRESVEEFLAIE